MKCPFCGDTLRVNPCEDGGFAMGCCCAFQGPAKLTKRAARRVVAEWLKQAKRNMRGMALVEVYLQLIEEADRGAAVCRENPDAPTHGCMTGDQAAELLRLSTWLRVEFRAAFPGDPLPDKLSTCLRCKE